MAIQAENVGDFVATTLRDYGRGKITDISSQVQRHVGMKHLFRKNRIILGGGEAIGFNVLVAQSNAARNVSLAEQDVTNTVDGEVQAIMYWKYSQTSYQLVKQLMDMNDAPNKIVDYVLMERQKSMISFVELMETNLWAAPSATDPKTPAGIPYWVTKNGTKGFNGGALTGNTVIANLSPTTYPGWQNWTGPFTNISLDDFVRAAREAATKVDWMPPVDGIPTPNTGDDYGFYCNYATIQPLEEVTRGGNDSNSWDIAHADGKTLFRRQPVVYVPWLDRDTTNPFYGINWGWMKTYVVKNWWMRETAIPITPNNHNIHTQFVDCTYQIVTKNRREHFVLSTGTSYPS
jgi:hypothetical protein